MNIDKKIEEVRKEFDEKIEKLKEEYEIKERVKMTLREGEEFYYLNGALVVVYSNFSNTPFDNMLIKYNRIFKTAEQAHDYANYLKARKEYSYEFSKEEWEDKEIDKYYIYYDYRYKKIGIGIYIYFNDMNTIYFKSREEAEEFIENYKKQILKFEFDIKEE